MVSLTETLSDLKKRDCDNLEELSTLRRWILSHEDVTSESGMITSFLLSTISTGNGVVMQEAILILTECVSDATFCRSMGKEQCVHVISELCNAIIGSFDKETCLKLIHCCAVFSCEISVWTEKVESVMTAINKAVLKLPSSATFDFELVSLVERLVHSVPCAMKSCCQLWWKFVLQNVAHSATRVHYLAMDTLKISYGLMQDSSAVMTEIIMEFKTNIIKGMHRLFDSKEENFVVSLWIVVIDLFEKVLHHGKNLVNCLLEVIEKAFKSRLNKTRILAISAWRHFVDKIATNSDVLNRSKTLKLLLQPLKSTVIKTDEGIKEKLSTWWHIAVSLQSHLHQHFDMVIEPLLQYCFSISSNDRTTSNATQDAANSGILTDVGVQILVALFESNDLDVGKTNFALTFDKLQVPAFSGCVMFSNHINVILQSLVVASSRVESSRKHRRCVLYIWKCIVSYVKLACNESRAVAFKIMAAFLRGVKQVVTLSNADINFSLNVLEVAMLLPHTVLTSVVFTLHSPSVLHGTPCIFLLHLLLQKTFVGNRLHDKQLMTIFETLVTLETASCVPYLDINCAMIQCIDVAFADFSQAHLAVKMWKIITHQLIDYVTKTNDANQLTCDFSCFNAALLLPIKHFFWEQLPVAMKDSMTSLWSTLYNIFSKTVSSIEGNQRNIHCGELAAKISPVIKSNLKNCDQLDVVLGIFHTMARTFDWSAFNTPVCTFENASALTLSKQMDSTSSLLALISLLLNLIEAFHQMAEETPNQNIVMVNIAGKIFEELHFIFDNLRNKAYIDTLLVLVPGLSKLMRLSDKPSNLFSDFTIISTIDSLWNKLTKSIVLHYKKKYDTTFLTALSPLLEVTLCHQNKQIRISTRQFWHATFATTYNTVILPDALRSIMDNGEPLMVPSPSNQNASTTDDEYSTERLVLVNQRIIDSSADVCNSTSDSESVCQISLSSYDNINVCSSARPALTGKLSSEECSESSSLRKQGIKRRHVEKIGAPFSTCSKRLVLQLHRLSSLPDMNKSCDADHGAEEIKDKCGPSAVGFASSEQAAWDKESFATFVKNTNTENKVVEVYDNSSQNLIDYQRIDSEPLPSCDLEMAADQASACENEIPEDANASNDERSKSEICIVGKIGDQDQCTADGILRKSVEVGHNSNQHLLVKRGLPVIPSRSAFVTTYVENDRKCHFRGNVSLPKTCLIKCHRPLKTFIERYNRKCFLTRDAVASDTRRIVKLSNGNSDRRVGWITFADVCMASCVGQQTFEMEKPNILEAPTEKTTLDVPGGVSRVSNSVSFMLTKEFLSCHRTHMTLVADRHLVGYDDSCSVTAKREHVTASHGNCESNVVNACALPFNLPPSENANGTLCNKVSQDTSADVIIFSVLNDLVSKTAQITEDSLGSTTPIHSPLAPTDGEKLSSLESPSVGILKKRKANVDHEESPSTVVIKHRRVSFADPLVQGHHTFTPTRSRKSVYRRLIMPSVDELHDVTSGKADLLSGGMSPENCKISFSMEPICPELIKCNAKVDLILHHLTSGLCRTRGLSKLLFSHNITTVGHLSALNEKEISKLPVKSPKIKVVKEVLRQFQEGYRKMKHSTDRPVVSSPVKLLEGIVAETTTYSPCVTDTSKDCMLFTGDQVFSSVHPSTNSKDVIVQVNDILDGFIASGLKDLQPQQMALFSKNYLDAHAKVLDAWTNARNNNV